MNNLGELWELLVDHGAAEMTFREAEDGNRCWASLSTLNDQTLGRICPELESVVLERCALAWLELEEQMRRYAAQDGKGRISSETIGGWSRSYAGPERNEEQSLRVCLNRWLGNTGLLYRGCD